MRTSTPRSMKPSITCGIAADADCPRHQHSRSGQRKSGPARELLQLIIDSAEHTLLLSPFLLMELERVLSYERVRKASKLTDEEVSEYLGYLRTKEISEMVFPGLPPRVVMSDPDDDPIVHTAVVGRANVLCTLNRHFYDPSVRDYCRERGVLVANDLELLDLLRAGKSSRS